MNPRTATTEPTAAEIQPTAADIERAFAEIEMRNLPPISRVMGGFFAMLGLVYLIAFPAGTGIPLLVLWLGLVLGFFGIAELVRRRKVTPQGIIWVSGLASLVATIGALVSMYVIAQPSQVIGACLLVLGLGLLV